MSVEYDPNPLRDYWKNLERHKAALEVQSRAERRERIATAALQGILACHEGNTALPKGWPGDFAIIAVDCADALIAELDREPQP